MLVLMMALVLLLETKLPVLEGSMPLLVVEVKQGYK
jgi:hypothetical protein